jgi:hypothetical protein
VDLAGDGRLGTRLRCTAAASLPPPHGLSTHPPRFSAEGRALGAASRTPVPLAELASLLDEVALQLRDVPDGGTLAVEIDP